MGMDVYGNSPRTDEGEYFRANLWSWRPIHLLCETVIKHYNLDMSTEGWEFNDGKGLDEQERCNELANALENYIEFRTDIDEDDVLYLNLGMWSTNDGSMLESNKCDELNETYKIGEIMTSSVMLPNGAIVSPAHGVSMHTVLKFIKFLRNCGGFSIL